MAKTIYVKSIHKGRERIYAGTLEDMIKNVFGYTLECGHSWNNKIPEQPKTAKSLIKALNDSAYECNNYYDSYYEATELEYEAAKKEGRASTAAY